LLFVTTDKLIEQTKAILEAEWELTGLGEPVKIIRIEIALGDCSITILQHHYLESILQKEGIDCANPISMPLEHNAKFQPNLDRNAGNCSNLYARLIGKLQFIVNAMRPDIAYMVSKLSSYTANPSMQHMTMLKRVLQYLSGTRSYGITYHNVLGHPNQFFGCANASFADPDDLKSTTGYVFKMSSGAIAWYSKKQSVMALLTMEAEYIALSEAT
jgi:hypothetical protein